MTFTCELNQTVEVEFNLTSGNYNVIDMEGNEFTDLTDKDRKDIEWEIEFAQDCYKTYCGAKLAGFIQEF